MRQMNPPLSIMKTTCQRLLVLPLLLALTGPLRAEPVNSGGTATNPTVLNAPAMPTPPTPPALPENSPDSDHVPVSIGPNGIHIGGPSPVDIGMSNFPGTAGHNEEFYYGFVLPVLIVGIVFLFLAFVIGMVLYMRSRRHKLLHETIRSMIEKGVPIPPELLSSGERNVAPRTRSDLRTGLMMTGAGIGLLLFYHNANNPPMERVGWIPILIGVAFLITWFIEKKNKNNHGGPTIK